MRLILIYIFLSLSGLTSGQCEIPEEFLFEKKEDYVNAEEEVFGIISCVLFNSTELDDDAYERGVAYAIIWIGGSSNYTVEVETSIAEFLKEEPKLLYPYILALILANKDFPNYSQEEKESEAINYLYLHYSEKSTYEKSRSLEKMVKKYKRGKLVNYLLKEKMK